MSELFENEAGIEVIIDDILVHGKTAEEHNRRLERTLRILQDVGVILNMSKCRFRVPCLIYFGHLVGAEGMSPHPDKVAAITGRDLPPPSNLSMDYLIMFPNLCHTSRASWNPWRTY